MQNRLDEGVGRAGGGGRGEWRRGRPGAGGARGWPLPCKPDFVHSAGAELDGHFSRPLARDAPLARGATNTRGSRAGSPSPVLSCTARGLPCRPGCPGARWALTPPFHPCLCPCGPSAVCFLLHFPSGRLATSVPRFREARCPVVSGLSSTPLARNRDRPGSGRSTCRPRPRGNQPENASARAGLRDDRAWRHVRQEDFV
jgi:hypothetical protein